MHIRSIRTPRHRWILLAATGTGLVVLTSCGGSSDHTAAGHTGAQPAASSSAGPAATGPHNQADVDFAADMIPHHAQAIEMADMAADKATDDEIKALAAAIATAQDPEIDTMTGWLVGWKQSLPSMGADHMAGEAMPGMMSADEMGKLDAAAGADFDRLWAQMMIKHHQGAIQMAREELARGQNTQAKALATAIIKAQTSEIATLDKIVKRLG